MHDGVTGVSTHTQWDERGLHFWTHISCGEIAHKETSLRVLHGRGRNSAPRLRSGIYITGQTCSLTRLTGLSELLCLVEDLYKHTLEVLLKDNYDDINYFHETICSDEAKVWGARGSRIDLRLINVSSVRFRY